jgi:predicted transcriptional regulator
MTTEEMERAIEFLLDHQAKVSAYIEQLTAEMREGFNNLIVANEVTRRLAEDVARLAVQNSQRITRLEERTS